MYLTEEKDIFIELGFFLDQCLEKSVKLMSLNQLARLFLSFQVYVSKR